MDTVCQINLFDCRRDSSPQPAPAGEGVRNLCLACEVVHNLCSFVLLQVKGSVICAGVGDGVMTCAASVEGVRNLSC